MSVQTTYDLNQPNAYSGLFADMNPKLVITKMAEGGDIPFGRVVSRGTGDNQCVIGGDGSPIGITGRDLGREGVQTTGVLDYFEDEPAAIMQFGYMFVEIKSASGDPGDPLYYDNATGEIYVGTAGAGYTQLAATLEETVSAVDQIALIKVNTPLYLGAALAGNVIVKGTIAVAADFPTSADVQIGHVYIVTAKVTDDDATKTNTGQTFDLGETIFWSGANWKIIGQNKVKHTSVQAVAATATEIAFVATGSGSILDGKCAVLTAAAAGESMVIDVKINGTTCLQATTTIDDSSGTTAEDLNIDDTANDLAAGDIVTIERTYTAGGGPTPMTDSAVSIDFTN
ncbi:hypothetical protein GWN42_13630 [candidate division KSB1 bacterium]|nr:hypothetical protein [candidate division KSB1 bacterium]